MYVYMEAETVKDNLPGRLGYAASKPRDGVFFSQVTLTYPRHVYQAGII